MRRIARFWKIVVLDVLGVIFMILAIALGWLPGPGGIPLFLVGLGLLAINHEWAERYIVLLKKYAGRFGELIFIKDSKIEFMYDALSPLFMVVGIVLLIIQNGFWMIPVGTILLVTGITFLLGNRNRWKVLKSRFTK